MKRVLIFAFCFSSCVNVNAQISFSKLKDRNTNMKLPESIKNMVVSNTKGMDAVEIADYCNNLTCDLLSYSTNVYVTPNLNKSKGHCVTYSTVCKELCNTAYKANNVNALAKVVVGQIKISNINIHEVITSLLPAEYERFFINHDIVEIIYDNKSLLIDPSLTDICNFKVTYNTTSE